ncbi:MAG: pyruvate:ferredoxin (flavodoxin) oxidoreductase [Deltaproteobacteria bacterium]|nr:pyruvate:ferredoxin (flavodoxin) oxidoreductase [Deltaproteobacteria bacterium]
MAGSAYTNSTLRGSSVTKTFTTVDGNEAAAYVAHATNEVIAIYPITPASPMGELSDAWSAAKRENIWGVIPEVIEMQSEAGAAGAVHGSLQSGALTTTFTASQGLLLMIPNMFKIAGELTPAVLHIAARSLATHALSIFGDHSDVMSARSTGFAMLASASVQEAQDLAMVSQMATLESRIPFLHFFDGFRTSHEVNKIEVLSHDDIRKLINEDHIAAHRNRALSPDRPVLRGSAQNPDVFFQAREAINPYYLATPAIVQKSMDAFGELTGRKYRLFDYVGAPDAERVIVIMGSGIGAVEEAVESLTGAGEKVGVLKIRLYRPFDADAFLGALPKTAKKVAVLDRTKEPGAPGEPAYLDVAAVLRRSTRQDVVVVGGRYGLSSKEFTPSMVKGIYDELKKPSPKHDFTVGIVDDVTHLNLDWNKEPEQEPADVYRAVFFGLGSDGTVGASKNCAKIVGETTEKYAQGYFVYDSKKAGAITISHVRFSPRPITSTYLIQQANYVACHQFNFLEKMDMLSIAAQGATFLLNSPYGADEVWSRMPVEVQKQIIDKKLKFYVIDANQVANEAGLKGRINTVMQTAFFLLADIIPTNQALEGIKDSVRYTYGKRGSAIVDRNEKAIDASGAALAQVHYPSDVVGSLARPPRVPASAPDFVQRITSIILEGRGDLLPVSAMPVDGTFPTSTAKFEKRSIAHEIPILDEKICIQCGLCALVCPHAAIRNKAFSPESAANAPASFKSMLWKGKEFGDGWLTTVQVAPDDCTGCGVCVDVCPARSKEVVKHKAINMQPKLDHLEAERANFDFFLSLPETPRTKAKLETIKGAQLLDPLFEYSGACAGCGETPYLKLMSQLFGDRALIANATGCSSIYGGNLPTTPWSQNAEGRGPAWSNSLFEDNAEFGLGMRLAVDNLEVLSRLLVKNLANEIGQDLATGLLDAVQDTEEQITSQRERVAALKKKLETLKSAEAKRLLHAADHLVKRSVWIVGGDGWAYDIGFGGLDHVFASGRNVNILVLDTEVYSNTGGQASKATFRGAVAKFAASGKAVGKKDLGMIAMAYGNVYVAQVAMGANPLQTLKAISEAEAYPGTSLVIAYSTCIAHGIDMTTSMGHQKDAALSGYWPLYRYDPRLPGKDAHPFHLDSKKPTIPFKEFAMKEARFAMLARADPARSAELVALAQRDIDERWNYYQQLAGVERHPVEKSEGI